MDYNNINYEEKYLVEPDKKPKVELEEPVSMKEWAITMLLLMIPMVNIVLMFVYAFSKDEKKSKSNFFKVQLIMTGIILAVYLMLIIFLFIFMAALGASMM